MAQTLSMTFECWNCTNPAASVPETSLFRFIAVEPNQDWHPICEECSSTKDLELPEGEVTVFEQDADRKFVKITAERTIPRDEEGRCLCGSGAGDEFHCPDCGAEII